MFGLNHLLSFRPLISGSAQHKPLSLVCCHWQESEDPLLRHEGFCQGEYASHALCSRVVCFHIIHFILNCITAFPSYLLVSLTDVWHRGCLSWQPLLLRLHPHGAVLSPAEKPTRDTCASRGTELGLSRPRFHSWFWCCTFQLRQVVGCFAAVKIHLWLSLHTKLQDENIFRRISGALDGHFFGCLDLLSET